MSGAAVADLVDFDRYPVADPTSEPARLLAARCRTQLQATGACLLPGFVREKAVAEMAAEGGRLVPLAHRTPNNRGTPSRDSSILSGAGA